MALSSVTSGSIVQKWASDYFAEYIRESGFKPYMGRSPMLPIHVKYELTDVGKTVNIPLVSKLSGAGVTGQTQLEGAEEVLNNYNHPVTINWVRNGVAQTEDQLHWTEIDLLKASREMLKYWSADKLRTDIISALGMIDGVSYATANATQKNAWNAANGSGRLLFGRLNSNFNATHATALLNVASTATLNRAVVTLMKRKAKLANPIVRPIRVDDGSGREYYVMFVGSLAFRDLKADMTTDNLDGRERNVETNPIFQDGDLIYDGVIIKEIPEIPVTGAVGTAGAQVVPVYFCGAQAVAVAWGMQPTVRQETRDYGHVKGTAIIEARGVNKCVFNGIDHGMITGFVAAAADA
jgi:N4-gp56 family major capsid protein